MLRSLWGPVWILKKPKQANDWEVLSKTGKLLYCDGKSYTSSQHHQMKSSESFCSFLEPEWWLMQEQLRRFTDTKRYIADFPLAQIAKPAKWAAV